MVLMTEHCQDAAGSWNGRLGFIVCYPVSHSQDQNAKKVCSGAD